METLCREKCFFIELFVSRAYFGNKVLVDLFFVVENNFAKKW